MTKIGLVLGAGGIRGCAHAGVISVLREAGIQIDAVVGASVGAMFGLGLAAGLPAERIAQTARQARPLDIFRFYAGRLRPNPSNPIGRLLLEAGEGKDFSDLTLPFAVLGTDVDSGEAVVLDSGPVLPAVQASIALPFIAQPVAHNGRLFFDGGLLDTAPIHVAHRLGAERVIAVCLGFNYSPPRFLRDRPWTRSIFERLGRQNGPATPRLRDHIRFGFRLYAQCYEPPYPGGAADISIWPEFHGLNPNSIFGAEFCFQQGAQAARQALPEILSLTAMQEAL